MVFCPCCPHSCAINRQRETGICGAGTLPRVARAALHHWEEPMFSGTRGSGTVFFSGCNLRCVFCQNHAISMAQKGSLCTAEQLAGIFLSLQNQGAHNINLVTPTPHIETLKNAIPLAKRQGLTIPLLYNCGGYERVEALQALDGLIDIYLPDLKYFSAKRSAAYANASDYFFRATAAIEEMFRQVGTLALDEHGIAKRGLLIRHLVLPCNLDETRMILHYIKDRFPPNTYLSLMGQYTPLGDNLPAPLRRQLTQREYAAATQICADLGLYNVYVQKSGAADTRFVPAFYDNLF